MSRSGVCHVESFYSFKSKGFTVDLVEDASHFVGRPQFEPGVVVGLQDNRYGTVPGNTADVFYFLLVPTVQSIGDSQKRD